MKHTLYILLLSIGLYSCAYGDAEYVQFDTSSYSNVEAFSPTRESSSDILYEAPWETLSEGCQSPVRQARVTDIITIIRNMIDMILCRQVHQVASTYMSKDANNQDIRLSGKVFYPEKGDIKNIILASHFTVGASYECPSETFALEGMLATRGYLVIVPDYIGYGESRDRVHPYLSAELTTRSVLDMAKAVIPWAERRRLPILSDSIILLGYSQGGASTLHTQIRIDELNKENPDHPVFKVSRTFLGAGPYDLWLTYQQSLKQDFTGVPCATPLLIQGMSEGMQEPLDLQFFFQEPLKSHYNEWLNSKDYTIKQINLLIGYDRISQMITPEGLDTTQAETKRLCKRLKENCVRRDFVPQPHTRYFVYHSTDDQNVPFANSQHLKEQFDAAGCTNVTYDFGPYGDHTTATFKFLVKCMKML